MKGIFFLMLLSLIGCSSSVPEERLDFIKDQARETMLGPEHNWQSIESIELNEINEGNPAHIKDYPVDELICFEVVLHGEDENGAVAMKIMYSSVVKADGWFAAAPQTDMLDYCGSGLDKSV